MNKQNHDNQNQKKTHLPRQPVFEVFLCVSNKIHPWRICHLRVDGGERQRLSKAVNPQMAKGLSPWRWHKEVLSVLVWISNRWYNCWLSITWCPAFKGSVDITKCVTLNLLLFLISCWLSITVFYLNKKATKSGKRRTASFVYRYVNGWLFICKIRIIIIY